MKHVRTSIEIDASADEVWRLVAEFALWPTWGPTVRNVVASSPEVAAGTRGKVQTPIGLWLPFEITGVEPGRSWDWRVAGIPATSHRLLPGGAASARLEFSVPWVAGPYLLVLRVGLRRIKRLAESTPALDG
ncbi:MAG: SRPBCC family protein [Acidimicrobiia bacterium]|nr:SRPBCC family protein [Acidimicrobiia bacterium]